MEELKYTAIEFEGILKLEQNLTMTYYIHNAQKVENRNVYDLLKWWEENKIKIDFTLSTDKDVFHSTGLVSKHNYNGIEETFIGNKNIEEFMFYHTEEKVKLQLRRA